MEWFVILALVVGVPLVLLPAALVLYLNVGGLYQMMRSEAAEGSCLQRRLKALIAILLAPPATVLVLAFLLAVAFVCIPVFIVSLPVIVPAGVIYGLSGRAARRVEQARHTG